VKGQTPLALDFGARCGHAESSKSICRVCRSGGLIHHLFEHRNRGSTIENYSRVADFFRSIYPMIRENQLKLAKNEANYWVEGEVGK
jgi:hypothetical protein